MIIEIHQIEDLLALDTAELAAAARAEGFAFVDRLLADYRSGANRFDRPGEALFGAFGEGRLVGIGGLNLDPYSEDASVGRVRRLYVLPEARRRGAGRRLVERVVGQAEGRFGTLTLRTDNPRAAAFYRALGFQQVVDQAFVTHRLVLAPS